ncbi:hypothetical protein [Collinsella sp. An2]|uniref:hypothetical protein n=1 Tax=Collinsella sp. An2 TaxID=1965585 RepID=UPI000B376044|nr:hypothetical protein [Collinsella sp. An2]OUP06137.1 hypothetical protein B5F33_10465 [Collinsella sp. An2]
MTARHSNFFSVGDVVAFETNHHELTGTVEIIDYRGHERACFKGCEWSYDIFVEASPDFDDEPCLYKHIPECDVRPE